MGTKHDICGNAKPPCIYSDPEGLAQTQQFFGEDIERYIKDGKL